MMVLSLVILPMVAALSGPLIVPKPLHDDLSAFAVCVEAHVTGTVFENCQEALPRVLVSSPLLLSELLGAVDNQIRHRRLDDSKSLQELLQARARQIGLESESIGQITEGGGADENSRLPAAPLASTPSIVLTNRPVVADSLSNGDSLRVPEGPPIILVAIAPLRPEKLAVQLRETLTPLDMSNRFIILPLDYLEVASVLSKEVRLLVETTPAWEAWAVEEAEAAATELSEKSWTTTTFGHQPVNSHAEYYIAGAGVVAAIGGVIVLVSTSLGTSAAAQKRAPAARSEVTIDW